jgi:hypothetical protein
MGQGRQLGTGALGVARGVDEADAVQPQALKGGEQIYLLLAGGGVVGAHVGSG